MEFSLRVLQSVVGAINRDWTKGISFIDTARVRSALDIPASDRSTTAFIALFLRLLEKQGFLETGTRRGSRQYHIKKEISWEEVEQAYRKKNEPQPSN